MARTSHLALLLLCSGSLWGTSCGKKTHNHVSDLIAEESASLALSETFPLNKPVVQTINPWGVKQVFCERHEAFQRQRQSACEVKTGSGRGLLLLGRVLTSEAIYENGGVAIDENGVISYVGCEVGDIEAARTVVCEDQLISPGLINAHDHLAWTNESPGEWGDVRYNHRHDWRIGTQGGPKLNTSKKLKNVLVEWGELRQLMHGTTSIAGSSKAEGFLRNLDVLDELQPHDQGQKLFDSDLRMYPGLINESFPLGDSGGHLQSDTCYFSYLFNAVSIKKSSTPIMLHVAEGIDKFARNEFQCLSGARQKAIDIIDQKTVLVHGIGLRAQDIQKVKERGSSLVWSPRSNISLYGQTTPVSLYKNLGVPIAIGTDWMPSGSSSLNREMTCALQYSQEYLPGLLKPRDIWLMATAHAASVFGKSAVIGDLKEGLIADISIYQGSSDGSQDPFLKIIESEAKDLLAVFKNGRFIYGAEGIIQSLGQEFANGPCQDLPVAVCGNEQTLCGALETKIPLAELFSQHEEAYPLFSCGMTPSEEPTCLPKRAGEYSGVKTSLDLDGDGVKNTDDNCPLFFNPKRPLDGFLQVDSDADGTGDECDPCPLNADNGCPTSFLMDSDQDGVANQADNCPYIANVEQKDRDQDAIGDACDACGDFANADGICPATLEEINHQIFPSGSKVRISGRVTFAEPMASNAKKQSFYFADLEKEKMSIPDFGGIFVYKARGEFKAGDALEVIGIVNPYKGQMQIWPLRIQSNPSADESSGEIEVQASPILISDLPAGEPARTTERYRWENRLVTLEALTLKQDAHGNMRLNDQILLDHAFAKIKTKSLCPNTPYIVTGFLSLQDESWAIRPRSLSDINPLDEACKNL